MADPLFRSRVTVVLTMLGFVALLVARPALADPEATSAQAAALEQQVRAAIGGVLGPIVRLSDRPVQMSAAGDHYDVLVPIAAEALDGSGKAGIMGVARPLAGGRWALENIKASSPLRFTANLPVPGQDKQRPAETPIVYTMDVQGQDGQVIWDPSFATASHWTMTTAATTVHAEGATLSQDSKLGPSSSTMTLQPTGADRADLVLDGSLRDYESDSLANDAPIHIGMQRVDVSSALNGVSRSRGLALAQMLMGLVADFIGPQAGQQKRPPANLAQVTRGVLAALQDVASDYRLDETIGGFAVRMPGQSLDVERLQFGLAAKSDGSFIEAGMAFGIEGLALPDLSLGPLGAFLPRRVAVHPVVSGLGVPELRRLVQGAADGRGGDPQDVAALFSHGGIRAALESMTVEVAGAVFRARAQLLAAGPSADLVSGTAEIVAENFDQLMQKVSATADAAQALPVLMFAKGAGRSDGNRLVWNLSYQDGKLLVNNVDLTAMMGGPAPTSPAPRPAGRSAAPKPGGAEGPAKSAPSLPGNSKQVPSWGK